MKITITLKESQRVSESLVSKYLCVNYLDKVCSAKVNQPFPKNF